MGKYKNLNLEDRQIIEELLNEGESFKSIGRNISKDSSTISKEVVRNISILQPSKFNNCFNNCNNRGSCKLKNVCGKNCDKLCKTCPKCLEYCFNFETEALCEKLLKPPYCCNPCKNKKGCRKEKHVYKSKEAHEKYLYKLSDSRKGINLTPEELEELSAIVTKGIKNGQSIAMICMNNPNINLSERTLYSYVENGIFKEISNLDLLRKVKYKKRNKNEHKVTKDTTIRKNRTYEDYLKYIEQYPNANIVQMDTVEGIKGGKCLFTLLFVNCNFMLTFLINSQTQSEINSKFTLLKEIWGENFSKDFEVILTDNGKEFSDPNSIEYISENEQIHVFYCDAGKSYQKAKIEKNHEFIRYIVPKGNQFDCFIQEDIDLMTNHINSTPRKELNKICPFDFAKMLIGEDILAKLNFKKIEGNDIILKPTLLKK